MKLIGATVLRFNKPGDAAPLLLSSAYDLSSFGFFQRGTVKDMCIFISRTLVERTALGLRQSVQNQEYMCHVYLRGDGLGGVIICDMEYPGRVAFTVLNKILNSFDDEFQQGWKAAGIAENSLNLKNFDAMIKEFQDPSAADKLTKIERDLDETKIVLHNTIDSMLQRGEKLDQLVDRSTDLSRQSKVFYKQAKRQNSCCSIM